MINSRIDWTDDSFNPISGCLHGCEYCYARDIDHRFGGWTDSDGDMHHDEILKNESRIRELDEPLQVFRDGKNGFNAKWQKAPYPYDFIPTFHRYRLNDYIGKKGRNIFVCSMADLFGKWVPDDWKIEVLDACKKAPQHNYIFLTKDPIGYSIWPTKKYPQFDDIHAYTENMWLGVTYTGTERLEGHYQEWEIGNGLTTWSNFWYLWRMSGAILPTKAHKFISIEPLSCDICEVEDERESGKLLEHFLLPDKHVVCSKPFFEWIIVGAETGRRKDKVVPKREWIEKLLNLCRKADIPLFMKSSLADIWGEPLIQEFPEGLKRRGD